MLADHRRKHTYWNIKGCGDAARVSTGKFLFFRGKGCGGFCSKCGTNVPPQILPRSRLFDSLNGRKYMAKPRIERSLLFPNQCCPKKVRAVHRNCLIERK